MKIRTERIGERRAESKKLGCLNSSRNRKVKKEPWKHNMKKM
jgi:hypothetical protein